MSDIAEPIAATAPSPAQAPTGSESASTPAKVADAASSGAAEAASTARDGAKEVAGEAVTQVKAVAGEARQQVSSLVEQTRGELSKQADERTKQAASGLRTLADQVDALANGRPDESGPLAGLLGEAHGRVSTFAERLESGGPSQLVDDVSNFARRRPIMFLAATVGAGFVVGRLARAGRAATQDSASEPWRPQSAYSSSSSSPALGSGPVTAAAPLDGPLTPPVVAQVP
jgi:hypothetical protein